MRAIEDLQLKGLKIIVEKPGFTYGHDAVMLAGFARPRAADKVLDLGAGTGILSLLLHGRTGCAVTAVEIRPEAAALMEESVRLNGLTESIQVLAADMRKLQGLLPAGGYDAAVCNPPYHLGGTLSPDPARRESTHQLSCTVYDAAECAAKLLKNGGLLWLCYPAGRMAECCHALIEHNLEPKRIRPVSTAPGKPPYLVLIEARKGGGRGLIWETGATEDTQEA